MFFPYNREYLLSVILCEVLMRTIQLGYGGPNDLKNLKFLEENSNVNQSALKSNIIAAIHTALDL